MCVLVCATHNVHACVYFDSIEGIDWLSHNRQHNVHSYALPCTLYLDDYDLQWLDVELTKFCYNMEWSQLRDNEKVSIRTIKTPTQKNENTTLTIRTYTSCTYKYACTVNDESLA